MKGAPVPAGTVGSAVSDDAPLVAALRRQDQEALRSAYRRFSPAIFRFLYRLTGSRHLADDLHQDTWVAVARHVAQLRPDSDLAAWLFTIARNKYRSWCRSTALWQQASLAERDAPGRPTAAADGGQVHDLEQALLRLAPPQREVLLLLGCEGLPPAQVARILNITPEAVRQRLSRARAALEHLLAKDELKDARVRLKGSR